METLIEKVFEQVKLYFMNEDTYDENKLMFIVTKDIQEFKSAGPYKNNETYYSTEERIAQDLLDNYFGDMIELIIFDYATIGAEGQTQHSENDISRHYVDRNKYFANICKCAIF